jgi:DNA-binding YbaB/EbfC family protein
MNQLNDMLKKAQKIQSEMMQMQQSLEQAEFKGASGAGMVEVTVNGKGEMKGIKINPELCQPGEHEVLEDLIIAASHDARNKMESAVSEKMAQVTGGLKLPSGMGLPF